MHTTQTDRATTRLLTTEEAAAILGMQPATLNTWRCTRHVELPFVKIGSAVRYRACDLDAFILRQIIAGPVAR